MSKNVLFIGRGLIAKKCFELITSPGYNFKIRSVVGDKYLFDNIYGDTHFIFNKNRNEDKIMNAITNFKINTLISVQHIWILSPQIIDAVNGFAFNLHNAKIPDYKGYNTISHSILNNELTYTTTIHWIIPEVDMGDIAYEEQINIKKNETAESLYKKSIKAAVKNFQKLINDLSNDNNIPRKSIIGSGKFYGKKDIDSLKEIKFMNDFLEVDRKSRAFDFPNQEPAYYKVNNIKFYIKRGT